MASATALPLRAIALTTLAGLGVAASKVDIPKLFLSTFTGPGSKSRIFAALVLLANLKNVPLAWHVRVYHAILKHCIFDKPGIPLDLGPSCLFAPVITSSRSPLAECDYNGHKSNSTYFSDLDISRCHLVCCLFQPGIEKLYYNRREKLVLDPSGSGLPAKGRWGIMLGGVMCSFKKEIKPYQPFEMWSRLLCWDRKWIYVVTHFVKKGAVKPSAYVLTDGSLFGGKGYRMTKGEGSEELDEQAVFASSIAKYVVKMGRLTVHPEVLLNASGILPEKPGGWTSMSSTSGDMTPPEMIGSTDLLKSVETISGDWDWKKVEAENERGLKYAEAFGSLDDLHHEFSGSKGPALGRYTDFIV